MTLATATYPKQTLEFRALTRANRFRRHRALFLLCVFSVFLSSCGWNHAEDPAPSDPLHRQHFADVRVMSWNVKLNSILPPDGVRHESFVRIVRAIDPDVIALQEVLKPGLVEELTGLMNRYVPLEDGASWQVHTVADNAIVSRYPLRHLDGELSVPYPIPEWGLPEFHFGFASALVDLPEKSGDADLYIVAMHNKSGAAGEQVQMRQIQSDSVVRWLRNLRDSDRETALSNNTPFVILGDMNVVPDASMEFFETLLSGNIADEDMYGPDIRIDWDETDLSDARPSHNALEQSYYTWRNDDLPFAPSALDRILFSDSVMSVRQRFVLNTMTMTPAELADRGLQKSDVLYGGTAGHYDHLPLVADFAFSEGPFE